VDLSPGCRQLPDRGFDASAYDRALQGAERSFPGSAVRAVLLYVNDIALPLPWRVVSDLSTLRALVAARGGLAPRVYALAPAQATASAPFDVRLAWTYGEDDAMWAGLARQLAADLPLSSRSPLAAEAMLLDGELGARAEAVKVCTVTGGARVPGCDLGTPCPLPPAGIDVEVAFPALWAMPRASVLPASAAVRSEACVAHCDRFLDLDGGLVRWVDHPGCVTEAP
jgi:hypothetical protein